MITRLVNSVIYYINANLLHYLFTNWYKELSHDFFSPTLLNPSDLTRPLFNRQNKATSSVELCKDLTQQNETKQNPNKTKQNKYQNKNETKQT